MRLISRAASIQEGERKLRTYDIINAGPKNRFMANGRIVSNSGAIVQLQNLFRNSLPDLNEARELVKNGDYEALSALYDSIPEVLAQCVRTAFIPAPGYKFIVSDFSAIEARVLAWLAGEQWVLDVFASGGDIYCETASRMFGVPVVKHGVNGELRQKGKQATLSCGYAGGVGALKNMGAIEAGMKEEELQPLVEAWRASNPNIVKLWYAVDRAAKTAIKEKTTTTTHGLEFKYQGGMLYIKLPSGRHLSYVKPRIGENRFGGESVTYMGTDFTKHWARIETFGGKLVENCLAEGTLVITDKGLVPIEKITKEMLIWDGKEFVHHDGLIYQGVRDVILVNDVYMTPDHKILTDKGWKKSGESNGFNWAAVSLPHGFEEGSKHFSGKSSVAVPLRMRKGNSRASSGLTREEVSCEVMRMHEIHSDKRSKENSRHVTSSGMGCMAQHEAEMSGPESSCLEKLRRPWNQSLRQMARKLRKLLGRHGTLMEEGTGFGPHRQQRKLHSGELPLDNEKRELSQQKKDSFHNHTFLEAASSESLRAKRDRGDNSVLQNGSPLACRVSVPATECKKPVYDIRNCGPRHRFAVWNGERALIVSNCVQAIARDILCNALEQLSEYRVVAHVHDECIVECPEEVSVEEISSKMAIVPSWAPGLVLRADGYECPGYYMKD